MLYYRFPVCRTVKKQVKHFRIVQHSGSIFEEVAAQAKKMGIKTLGFEQDHLSYSTYTSYKDVLKGIEFVPVSNIVEKLRLIKTDEEIKILKEAAEIVDAAFTHILHMIRPGVREIELANELEFLCEKRSSFLIFRYDCRVRLSVSPSPWCSK